MPDEQVGDGGCDAEADDMQKFALLYEELLQGIIKVEGSGSMEAAEVVVIEAQAG